MFLMNDAKRPQIEEMGSEDYFLGAWSFGDKLFSYATSGAPVAGQGHELQAAGGVHTRFYLDQPVPRTKSLNATIEHGA